MDNPNKMHNWFVSIVVSERVDVSLLDNTRLIGDNKNFPNENYLMSDGEQLLLRKSSRVLICRVFQGFFDQDMFKFLSKVCKKQIHLHQSLEMNDKMSLFPMPMHIKDEKKLADMIDILCEREETWVWQKSGATNDGSGNLIPDDFSCHFSGYHLTCIRATSARHLRAGCHTLTDRLAHTEPDVFELWHAKQNLLVVRQQHKGPTKVEGNPKSPFSIIASTVTYGIYRNSRQGWASLLFHCMHNLSPVIMVLMVRIV